MLKALATCLISGSLTFLSLVPGVVFAQATTDITATLCDVQGPEIVLNTPISDSVTNLAIIPIQGTAVRTSQIDIYRNNQYDQSVSVSQSNPQISTTIALTEGTNTIRLEAFYSCNQTNATLTRIVTFKPDATGGNQSNTDTKVTKPGNTKPRIISNPDRVDQGSDESLLDRIKDNLTPDKEKTGLFIKDYVEPIYSWLALIAAILFAVLALLPRRRFIDLLGTVGLKNIVISKKYHVAIRIGAALLAVIFATIVQA